MRFRDDFNISDQSTQKYWHNFDCKSLRERSSDVASTYNTFTSPLLDKRVQSLFDTSETKFSFAKIEGKTTIVRLPVSEYGPATVKFVGSLVLAYAHHFADGWSIYVDDCDLFAKNTLIDLYTRNTSSVTVAHQYLDQIHPDLRDALIGNCDEHFCFRMSQKDAKYLEPDRSEATNTGNGSMLYDLKDLHYRGVLWKKRPDLRTVPLEK